jgi:ATPase subunit of ABC transporter with duplicated ATPase domains
MSILRALEEGLENFGCAVVISHDRWFLDRICTHILALKETQKYTTEGGFLNTKKTRKTPWW